MLTRDKNGPPYPVLSLGVFVVAGLLVVFTDQWKNDIALVKLTQDLPLAPLDDTIDAIKLPNVALWPSSPNVNCSVQGWGCTSVGKYEYFNVTSLFCAGVNVTYTPFTLMRFEYGCTRFSGIRFSASFSRSRDQFLYVDGKVNTRPLGTVRSRYDHGDLAVPAVSCVSDYDSGASSTVQCDQIDTDDIR